MNQFRVLAQYMCLIFSLSSINVYGQSGKIQASQSSEQMPVAGDDVDSYLLHNLTLSDSACNLSGKLLVKFLVNKDGHITNSMIIKGVCEQVDQAVLSRIKSMPPWKPALSHGKPIETWFTLPVYICIQ